MASVSLLKQLVCSHSPTHLDDQLSPIEGQLLCRLTKSSKHPTPQTSDQIDPNRPMSLSSGLIVGSITMPTYYVPRASEPGSPNFDQSCNHLARSVSAKVVTARCARHPQDSLVRRLSIGLLKGLLGAILAR